VVAILAGVFFGRIVHELPGLTSQLVQRIAGARTTTRLATHVGTWGTVAAVVLVAGSMFGAAHRQYRLERQDLRHERARTAEIGRLSTVVSTLGASNIFACGQPNLPIAYQSIFAWYSGVKTGVLYVSPGYLKAHPHPLVNIYPIAGGWKVFPSHADAAHAAACHRMRLVLRR
jgi:putative effector of murein hydrolase